MLTLENISLPIPFSIAPPPDFTTPYIVALLGVIIAVAALLIVFPSLRKYRRKRNILVYSIALLVVALLVFQISEAPSLSRRAIVEYGFVGDPKYYNREGNQLVMACHNHGDKAASFYLVLSGFNASFQVKTQQDYIQTSNRTVKVPFSLQESGLPLSEDKKPVFFTIDENVEEFSFTFSYEAEDYNHLVFSSGSLSVKYVWNATENCFIEHSGSHFT
jgi:hypothetical protein